MRLDRLDLLAYGHFTNRAPLDFSPPALLHVVYGPNEAGKSTTLAAVSDLLYGYKAKDHPYTFLHQQPLLGGVVRGANGERLEFVRKRTKSGGAAGLLAPDQKSVLPDDALAPFLLGVGRDDFERLYGLNHQRLRDGGRQMLDPASDIGRKLFAAGTGLDDLHRVEAALAADIERIGEHAGGKRGVASQLLKAAASDYNVAEAELKAASLKAGEVTKARARLAAADDGAQAARRAVVALAQEKERLARAQRTRPLLAKLDQLRALTGGREAPDLPADLAARWDKAARDADAAATEWRRRADDEAAAAADLAATPAVGPFADLAQTITELQSELGGYLKAGKDLPLRRTERDAKIGIVAYALRELGLTVAPEGAEACTPTAADRAAARDLARQRADCRQALAAAAKTADKAGRDAADAERTLSALGAAVDGGEAAALAEQAATLSDAPAKLDAAAQSARVADADAGAALSRLIRLGAWEGDCGALAALAPPTAAAVAAFEAELGEIDAQSRTLAERLLTSENLLADARAKIGAVLKQGEPASQHAVDAARRRRDAGLALLIAAARGAPDTAAVAGYAPGGDLEEAVLAAVDAADSLADRRAAEAKRAQAYEAALEMEAVETARQERLAAERAALTEKRARLMERWRVAWGPVKAGRPADMRDWLTARQTALDLAAKAGAAAGELAAARLRHQRWAGLWRAAATALGGQAGETEDAAVIAARAQNALQKLRLQEEQRRAAILQRDRAAAAAAAAQRELAGLSLRRDALNEQWARLMPRLGQSADLPDAALETVLERWGVIDGAARERRDLDHRIDGMRRDRAVFEARVEEARRRLPGVDLPAGDPAATLAALRQGLDDDRRRSAVLTEKRQARTTATKALAAAARARDAAAQAAAGLRAAYGLEDGDDAPALCALADGLRDLLRAGDGRDEATLRAELDQIDAADADARLQALAHEQSQAQAAYDAALTEQGEAKTLWDQMQRAAGAEAAAYRRNAAARRAALAAEELLQLKAAQILLRRAVDRYREANQDPLLARASALFAAVAAAGGGAGDNPIVGLESRIGADDRPTLHALRRDGGVLGVAGLSEGAADQLFLALRLAALEQRATAGRALPFIADDIFMTFDDGRTEAGLRLLAELGRTTQVILFTHHARVVEAAQAAADGAANVVELA